MWKRSTGRPRRRARRRGRAASTRTRTARSARTGRRARRRDGGGRARSRAARRSRGLSVAHRRDSGVAASGDGVSVMGSASHRFARDEPALTRRTTCPKRASRGNPMTTFPPLTHVAVTVRDLSVSVPWYEALFDAEPVLDEDTDPDFHHTVYLLGTHAVRRAPAQAPDARRAVQRVPRRSRPRRVRLRRPRASSRSGRGGSTSSASPTAASRTRPTGRG